MRKLYTTYAEIPITIENYILTVADKKHIMDIPLEDINSFLSELNEYYKTEREEHTEGWV